MDVPVHVTHSAKEHARIACRQVARKSGQAVSLEKGPREVNAKIHFGGDDP